VSWPRRTPAWVGDTDVGGEEALGDGHVDVLVRSYELFARHVAPHFQGHYQPTTGAKARARAARPVLAENHLKAIEQSTAKYQAELDTKARS
jgi:ABC-type nitrate/sulfonate/bicarbonate transport system substrate-binding protein